MRLALAWLAALAPLAAQETPVFRSETTRKLVRFRVAQKGYYVETLRRDDIVLLEDAVFDASSSVMNEGLLDPLVFQSTLLDGLDRVRVAVYGFGDKLRRYCPPTRDFERLRTAIAALRTKGAHAEPIPIALPPQRRSDPRGATWIHESVIGVARDMTAQPAAASHMMLVFSDGLGNTTSVAEDASKVCNELGVAVYRVLLGHWRLGEQMSREEERMAARKNPAAPPSATADRLEAQERDVQNFAALGPLTGGHSFDPPAVDLTLLRRVLAAMVGEARTEYVLGFTPDGAKHKWQVRLRDRSLGQIRANLQP